MGWFNLTYKMRFMSRSLIARYLFWENMKWQTDPITASR